MHQVHDFKQKQPPACAIWYKNPCGGVFWPSQTLWAELGQFLCELQPGGGWEHPGHPRGTLYPWKKLYLPKSYMDYNFCY